MNILPLELMIEVEVKAISRKRPRAISVEEWTKLKAAFYHPPENVFISVTGEKADYYRLSSKIHLKSWGRVFCITHYKKIGKET